MSVKKNPLYGISNAKLATNSPLRIRPGYSLKGFEGSGSQRP